MGRLTNPVVILTAAILVFSVGCTQRAESEPSLIAEPTVPVAAIETPVSAETPAFPDLQAELLDERYRTANSPIGQFDFTNHTFPLPRGWQNPDGSESTLVNGRLEPVSVPITEDMPDEEKVRARAERRIGLSHVITKYLDATGDGIDEAIVILKIETTGAAIPQIVYVYEWKDDAPNLIWHFRTGDRADGGLKDIRLAEGELVIELFGQDRFLLGQTETMKITGDEEQLCCPIFYTRSAYTWNGTEFIRKGPRLTYSVTDPSAPPVENMAEIINKAENARKHTR